MKKHRLHNFILGVLILALLVALAIPALAMTGQKQMTVDYLDIKLAVDGVPVGDLRDSNGNSVEPFACEGTTYLPVRAVGEALGKEVRWDGPTRTVYITDPAEPKVMTAYGNNNTSARKETIEVDYLDIRLVVDGKEVTPRDANGKVVEPFAYNGATYLPVRAVGEALGKTVRWDGETKTVHLGELPQGTYLVDACKVAGAGIMDRNMYRAVDGKSFTMSDGKRYSQGFMFQSGVVTFELGGKYESLTFDLDVYDFPMFSLWSSGYFQVYLDGELAQEIEVTEKTCGVLQTVTVPLNYAQTVSFSNNVSRASPKYRIANAVLNGERAVAEKPAPPANVTYLVDACTVEHGSKYKAAEEDYFKDIFGNQYTNGIAVVSFNHCEVNLNGGYKTLKATIVKQKNNYGKYLDTEEYKFSVDGEVVREITLSNVMPSPTIEIPLNYGMKLEIERDYYSDGFFLADAILE